MAEQLLLIDGIAWQISRSINGVYRATPICPIHRMELDVPGPYSRTLKCPDCEKRYEIPKDYCNENKYAIEKYKAIIRQSWSLIDVDGVLTPVTKKEKIGKREYFCTAQVRDSKRGPQVVIYAGKKGRSGKSQIFITPEERRLSFDQNDINPADIFTKITAEFDDGVKHVIEKNKGDS